MVMPQVKQDVDVANAALHYGTRITLTQMLQSTMIVLRGQLRILLPRHGRLRSVQRSVQRRSAQSVMLPRNGWLRSVQRSAPTPHVC